MGVKLFILVAGTAGVIGLAGGYFLRWLVSLGKKGSMELRVKQMELEAKERSKQIVDEAEGKATKVASDLKQAEREKELARKKADERLLSKEDLFLKRQTAVEQDLEGEKRKEVERVA